MEKFCKECNDKFIGRSDAKFCSDQCRSSYNNKENGYQSSFVRRINAILRRNRKILSEYYSSDIKEVRIAELTRKGFDFAFYTATHTTESGDDYKFCYDQGYLDDGGDKVELVIMEEYGDDLFGV